MPKVKINYSSQLEPEECFQKVKKVVEEDPTLKKLDPNFTCSFDEDDLCGSAKSKQFKAKIEVQEDGDGSLVDIVVELPFHLALASGVVKSMLTQKLQKYVG